jgi:hypothetical protein
LKTRTQKRERENQEKYRDGEGGRERETGRVKKSLLSVTIQEKWN